MIHPAALAAFLLWLLSATLGAVPARAQGARGGDPLPEDTTVIRGRLPNGLSYYVRSNREPAARAELRLVVNAGSVLEDPDQLGLAHFLEHMAFNGTRRFGQQQLVNYLESIGMRFGPDINAYTSFDETVFLLTVPTDSAGVLDTGLQILEDWAQGISLDSLEIEKERGVVIEEWRLGQGADARMQNRQFPVLARGSRYANRLPIGTLSSLQTFRHDALRRFYREWYRPDLMAVVAVGDFDADSMAQVIRERFSALPKPRRPRRRQEFDVPPHRQTLVSIATDPEATSATVSLYLKRRPRPWRTTAVYRDWIVESLASSMLTNRLSELTQRPDAPFLDISSFHGRFIRPLSALVLSARTADDGIEPGMEALLAETQRVAQHGFTASELEREKRELMRMMEQRHAERNKTTSSGFASDYVSHFLYGGALVDLRDEHALYQRFLPGIRLEEVNAAARTWMREGNRVLLVRAPQKAGVEPPKEARLRRILTEVERRRLQPYRDSVSDAPLVSHPPRPGRVVSERHIAEVGVLEWTLDNGVRVLIKPTDFKEDEILLVARSPGGSSLVPDADYVAALTAPAVVQAGGLGELSAVELRKRLAGKLVGVGADIGDLYEGLSGAASPQDLETLFQLVYLKFTAPRVDSSAFLAYQSQGRAALESRSASPETVFSDSLRVVLAQGHPRARPPSSELFDHLDLHRSFEIYRDRFADASDFTFYLVGTLDPEQLRPLVERYLGGLPSLGRVEQGRDLGIRPPTGVVRRSVYRGVEAKALTQIVFTGDFEFSRRNVYLLGALGDVLTLRLREVLREDLGGTYGVSVRAGGWRDPHPQFQVSIGFGTAPQRLQELTRVTFAQIDSLRSFGPREQDVLKVREMQLRAREVEMRRNHFWIQQLITHDRHGWDLREMAEYDRWVQELSPAAIQAMARRYLDPHNHVQVSLLPESSRPNVGEEAEPVGGEAEPQR